MLLPSPKPFQMPPASVYARQTASGGEMFKLQRATVRSILAELGWPNAQTYTDKMLLQRLQQGMEEKKHRLDLMEPLHLRKALRASIAAMANGETLVLVDGPHEATMIPKHLGQPKPHGIVGTIKRLLMESSKENPISDDMLLETLKEKFPDREVESMRRTMEKQLSSVLRKKGHDVRRGPRGSWIQPKGNIT